MGHRRNAVQQKFMGILCVRKKFTQRQLINMEIGTDQIHVQYLQIQHTSSLVLKEQDAQKPNCDLHINTNIKYKYKQCNVNTNRPSATSCRIFIALSIL